MVREVRRGGNLFSGAVAAAVSSCENTDTSYHTSNSRDMDIDGRRVIIRTQRPNQRAFGETRNSVFHRLDGNRRSRSPISRTNRVIYKGDGKPKDSLWRHDLYAPEAELAEPTQAGSSVFLRGVPPDMTIHDIKSKFSTCGTVVAVKIEEGRLRTAHVSFLERGAGVSAVGRYNNVKIDRNSSLPLKVALVETHRQPEAQKSVEDDFYNVSMEKNEYAGGSRKALKTFQMASDAYLHLPGGRVSAFERLE